ncbi:MAG: hypothetical protein ACP5UM_05740 [Anaerolineae bacterium]
MARWRQVWHEWWPCLGLAVLTALVFGPAWTGRSLLYGGLDIQTIHYPFHAAYATALHQGRLPLWTPLLGCGFPLFGEGQIGGLYPPNLLLYRLLPLDLAHNWSALLHLLLALVTTYALARRWGLSRAAAALAGFAYAWSVPATTLGDFVPAYAMAWLPALLAALDWGYRSPRWPAFLAAGVILGFQGLIFFPQGMVLTGLAAGLFALVQMAGMEQPRALRALLGTLGAAALGAALSAVQWLPTLELTRFSIRAGGLAPAFAAQGSLPPWAVATFWAPHFLAVLVGAGYVGILPLILAAFALPSWREDRRVGFALLLGAVSLILAFGRYSPLFPLVRQLPGLSFFRNAYRFTFLTRFALALLAGLGWDRLVGERGDQVPRRLRRWALGVAGASVAVTGAALFGGWLLGRLEPFLADLGTRYALTRLAGTGFHVQSEAYFQAKVAQMLGQFRASLSPANGELWAALALGFAAACWLLARARWRSTVWAVAGVALVVGDLLGHLSLRELGFVPAEQAHAERPAVAFLREELASGGRLYTLVDQPVLPDQTLPPYPLPENANLRYGIPSVGLYSSLGYLRLYELLKDLGAVNLAFGVAPTDEATLRDRLPLLSLLRVRAVLAVHPLQEPLPPGLELAYTDGEAWVYRNREAFPRAFVLAQAEAGLPPEEVRGRMLRPDFRPEDAVLLEDKPGEEVGGFVGTGARLVVDEADRMTVETQGGGWLVLADAFYPGWRAWVDGVPTPIYRADYVLRAVPLGPGAHWVEFRYEPVPFRVGCWVSGLAWAGTLASLALLARRQEEGSPPLPSPQRAREEG